MQTPPRTELVDGKKPLTIILRVQIAVPSESNVEDTEYIIRQMAHEAIKGKHPEVAIYATTLDGWDY